MAGGEAEQLVQQLDIVNPPDHVPTFRQVVVAGMGGSALAGDMCRDWLDLPVPLQVVKDYTLPNYVSSETLVIACSFSGNTEETLSAFEDARQKGVFVVVAAGGGQLVEAAKQGLPYVFMPYDGTTPRMFLPTNLRAFLNIFVALGLVQDSVLDEVAAAAGRLASLKERFGVDVSKPSADSPAMLDSDTFATPFLVP